MKRLASKSFDVFTYKSPWPKLSQHCSISGKHIAFISFRARKTTKRKRLTRRPASKQINILRKKGPIDLSNITFDDAHIIINEGVAFILVETEGITAIVLPLGSSKMPESRQ